MLQRITCWLDEQHNALHMANGNLNIVIVPNGLIDEFIEALQEHMASTGSGLTFTLGFESGKVELGYKSDLT